jgi:hypothetical protein
MPCAELVAFPSVASSRLPKTHATGARAPLTRTPPDPGQESSTSWWNPTGCCRLKEEDEREGGPDV